MEEQNLLNDFEEPKYQFVGFWPRFAAILIDGIILAALAFIINLILDSSVSPSFALITGIIPFLYNPILEYKYGATVGKMALGIKIVNYDLQKLTFNNVIFRNIIYFAIQLISLSGDVYRTFNKEEQVNPFANFTNFEDLYTTSFIIASIYFLLVFVIYIIELVFLLTDEKHRSLHDRIGKTYVVRKTN